MEAIMALRQSATGEHRLCKRWFQYVLEAFYGTLIVVAVLILIALAAG